MKTLVWPILYSICFVFFICSPAKADEIVQQSVLSDYTFTNNGNSITDVTNIPLEFRKFDPSLGRLNSVSLIVSGSAYDNWLSNPTLGGATESIAFYLSYVTGNNRFTSSNYFDVGWHNKNVSFYIDSTDYSPSDISYFTGTGLTNWSIFWESEGFGNEEELKLNSKFLLTYNYSPTSVPEPGSFGLLMFGFMALYLVRYRHMRGVKKY